MTKWSFHSEVCLNLWLPTVFGTKTDLESLCLTAAHFSILISGQSCFHSLFQPYGSLVLRRQPALISTPLLFPLPEALYPRPALIYPQTSTPFSWGRVDIANLGPFFSAFITLCAFSCVDLPHCTALIYFLFSFHYLTTPGYCDFSHLDYFHTQPRAGLFAPKPNLLQFNLQSIISEAQIQIRSCLSLKLFKLFPLAFRIN